MTISRLLVLLALCVAVRAMRKQGVAVKGRLTCDGQPLQGVKVKIFDVDRNPGDSDDLLDEGVTDRDGRFKLDGTTRELTTIEPEIRIYHDCNDGIKPCRRKFVERVPEEFIHHGTAEKWYEFNRDMYPPEENEQRTCTDI